LVERFNENLKFFLNSDSFEKGKPENERVQAAQLAALNSVAKRENLKPLSQLPQTIQQKTMEDAAKQLGQKMDQSKTQNPQSQTTSSYVVQKGDTLFNIAQKMYGDGKFWTLLFQANSNLIKNPDMIQVGWNLAVPAKTQTPPPAPRTQPKTQTQQRQVDPQQTQQVPQQVQQAPQQVPQQVQQVQQAPQKPTKALVEEYAYAPSEQSKDEKMQQLVQNMYAVARSGRIDKYLEHLRTFPIDPKTADQHGYEILKETLTGHSGMATLANSYLKAIRDKSFAELDRDYDDLSSLNAIFSRAGMDNEAKWAQHILRLVDKARDAK
jgi:LysM repeat protein